MRIEDDFRESRRLQKMMWLCQRGFRVTENHPAREDMPTDRWFCTLSGEKMAAAGEKLTVRFWEHREDEDGFYAEVHGAEDSKEGTLTREVMRLGSTRTQGEGAYIVESNSESKLRDDSAAGDG